MAVVREQYNPPVEYLLGIFEDAEIKVMGRFWLWIFSRFNASAAFIPVLAALAM